MTKHHSLTLNRSLICSLTLVFGLLSGWTPALVTHSGQDLPAQSSPARAVPTGGIESESPAGAIAGLQAAHLKHGACLVFQSEFDWLISEGGGGACASVAAINSLQVLRAMSGLDHFRNPHKVMLAILEKQRHLLNGRVSNSQFITLLTSFETYLPRRKLDVSAQSAPSSPNAEGQARWPAASGPDLTVSPMQLKVLCYTVSEAGTVIGRHFVILKNCVNNEVTVLDPNAPTKDYRYILHVKVGDKGAADHIYLMNPPEIQARARVYELDTIFVLSLRTVEEAGVPGPATDASVDFVKKRFEETAAKLRGTKEWLSPRAWREHTAIFGLPGLDLPQDLGGAGWSATKTIEIFRYVGQRNLNFRDIVGGAHVRPMLKSSNRQVMEIVRQVAIGKGYIAIAITEPTAGSDIPAIKTTSRKVAGGFLLSGTKRFNARLEEATHVIIFSQSTTGQEGKLSAFVVPITAPGLQFERINAHGLTGNSYGGMSFSNLFVRDSHLLGSDGGGHGNLLRTLSLLAFDADGGGHWNGPRSARPNGKSNQEPSRFRWPNWSLYALAAANWAIHDSTGNGLGACQACRGNARQRRFEGENYSSHNLRPEGRRRRDRPKRC